MRSLRLFLAVYGVLWVLAAGCAALQRFFYHRPYPYNTFLFDPFARFWDFTVFAPRYAVWGPGGRFFSIPGFPFPYGAPTMVAGLLYYKITSHPLAAYLATLVLFAIAISLITARASRPYNPSAIAALTGGTVLSFPLLYLIDRGNVEGFVWIASASGLLLFARRMFLPSALLLAAAASMKLFPALLLLLFLAKKRYREFGIAIVASLAITAVSLWIAGPTVPSALHSLAIGAAYLRDIQVLEYRPREVGFDHSLFGVVKQVSYFATGSVTRLNLLLPGIYVFYGAAALALFAWLYLFRIRRLPVLNQALVLSAFSVLLPFVSYDYTLVHLFVPFALLVIFLVRESPALTQRQILWFLLPFALLFTPQSYLLAGEIGYGGQLKSLALVALNAAALSIPLKSSLFDELPAA